MAINFSINQNQFYLALWGGGNMSALGIEWKTGAATAEEFQEFQGQGPQKLPVLLLLQGKLLVPKNHCTYTSK
eukprot:403345113